ncbi:hypothetical protein C0995_005394 [Termitomyces sp. Mi166|nr:hypothetical protein C0995_005394 [Termitomyces sp. Mi166\
MVIELELTVPIVVPKTVVDLAPTPASATSLIQCEPSLHSELSLQEQEEVHAISSTLLLTQEPSQQVVPCNKDKGKVKATEDDEDEEGEATQKLRKELEDFVVPTKFDNKLLVSLLPPPSEYYEGDIGLPQGAKISGGRKGDITLVLPAMQVLVLEKNGTGCCCKSKGCLWNGIGIRMQKKRPPLAALIIAKRVKLVQVAKAFLEQQSKLSQFFVLEGYKGKGKAKALLGDSEQMGAKQSFKSMELVDSDSDKEEEEDRVHIIKKINLSNPAPVKSTASAIKGGFIFKIPFYDEESSDKDKDSNDDEDGKGDNEDSKGDDDDSNDDDATMDIDNAKCPEET